MTRYIALLRGINVGGHTVKMERLRALFAELGLENVRSYINSGNIFFDTDTASRSTLASSIEQHLAHNLGYAVPVFLRTAAELEAVITESPFHGKTPDKDERFCVVFVNEPPNIESALPLHSTKNDMDLVAARLNEVFIVWRIIGGRPPSGTFPTSVLPRSNTTRFFHTLEKILRAAQKDT